MIKPLLNFLIGILIVSCSPAQPSEVPQPQATSGYLYKVEPGIPGKKVYICGQRPFNSTGEVVGPGNLEVQTRQVFENIITSLKTVDLTLLDVTQVTYLVKGEATNVDSNIVQSLNNFAATYFTKAPGIVEMKGISLIARDDILIEVEVIAIK